MKIKCPSCQLLLQIPESAAGKLIKCKCGKQLRAPGASPAPASNPSPSPVAKPAGANPSPAPVASRPGAPKPASPAPFDASLLDELTDVDLQPVKAVGQSGKPATHGTGKGALSSYEKEAAEGKNSFKAGAAKEVYSSIGILLFLGLLRVCLNGYFLWNVEKEVEELGLDPSFEGEEDGLLKLVKAFYILGISIGAVFLTCAALIFKFPMTCSIVALVTFVISEIIGLVLNPFRLFSIGGWIARGAIFGGLVQTVNNASYYKFVKSGGRG